MTGNMLPTAVTKARLTGGASTCPNHAATTSASRMWSSRPNWPMWSLKVQTARGMTKGDWGSASRAAPGHMGTVLPNTRAAI